MAEAIKMIGQKPVVLVEQAGGRRAGRVHAEEPRAKLGKRDSTPWG